MKADGPVLVTFLVQADGGLAFVLVEVRDFKPTGHHPRRSRAAVFDCVMIIVTVKTL